MYKKIIYILIIFSVGISVALTYYLKQQTSLVQEEQEMKKEPEVIDPIVLQVRGMSLDEKIGQLLMVGFVGQYLDSHIQKMVTQYHIGGVNLLARNVKDSNQVKKLISDLQKISSIPLFIGTDQEGGINIRFKFLQELTPQTKISDTVAAEQIAFDRAAELKDLGVNMNFSPVVDYVSNDKSYLYKRTFGASPNTAGELANAMIDGYLKGGVIAVAKHFPGYGNVVLNPHTDESVLPISVAELEINLASFIKVLTNKNTGAIMTAHIVIPEMDSKPATLSYKFITEILRNRLGFNGVVITDDIEMASVGHSVSDIAVESIKAGNDIIIDTYTPKNSIIIFDRLKQAVLNKEISKERIDQSVIRILNLKKSIGAQ